MDKPLLSIAKIVEVCRTLPGFWLDHFKYDLKRECWTFRAPDGVRHHVGLETMPEIARELGGWPEVAA